MVPFSLLQTSPRNDQSHNSEENAKTVALLLPESDIMLNAAFLAGIVPQSHKLHWKHVTKSPNKEQRLPQSKKYTPIIYILDDVSPPPKAATVECSQIEKDVGQQVSPDVERPSLRGIGISGFRNLSTPASCANLQCKL